MRKTVLLLASMAAALVLASVVALGIPKEQARAAFPGINGKIAFTRDPDGYRGKAATEIYTISVSGNNLKRLTSVSRSGLSPADNGYPSWSADGKKIVFSRFNGRTYYRYHPQLDIFTMNADGSNRRRIVNESSIRGRGFVDDRDGTFSPNGRQIVFSRDAGASGGVIYKINADGSNLTRLTEKGIAIRDLGSIP